MDDSAMQTADVDDGNGKGRQQQQQHQQQQPQQMQLQHQSVAKITTNAMDMIGSSTSPSSSASMLVDVHAVGQNATLSSSKSLKRCLSVPVMTTRSAAAAAAAAAANRLSKEKSEKLHETPKKCQHTVSATPDSSTSMAGVGGNFANNLHIGIPRSNPSSREVSPAPVFNIFAPRARRYSASYSPLGAMGSNGGAPLCITPRVSQLRQEECVDMVNNREANHEREVHSAIQMSQSWEDLTLVAENWSCKSDELSNPLQVVLPSGATSCSSPSPTNNRAGLRPPYVFSPSPTRRTFATRRSMSPNAMRPSQLGPVKRKFELEDNNSSNWNVYSPPAPKKIFTESRGSSPVCQSPSSVCPSPDSGTYEGRITPKLFISKLCTSNANNSSACSSPSSVTSGGAIDSTGTSGICSSSSSSVSSMSGGTEPMCIGSSMDEGISIAENDEKLQPTTTTASATNSGVQPMATDIQDEATLMDDMKSETSSIGGCSSISIESSSCDSATKAAASFLNKLNVDDISTGTPAPLQLGQKNFFINKQGLSGAKKFIVNHDNLPNSNSEHADSISSTTSGDGAVTRSTSGARGGGAGVGGGGGGGGGSNVGVVGRTMKPSNNIVVEQKM